ncbi:methyltransferase [Sphingomonas sp. JC676]|uniref:methyltransferase n=1 Tax=Sphingomonas sp. JC676 TaxID=2768065 RepID=UPI00165770B0|nr:methyltransferase [Sphingomonas sp. JC676]MBC9033804.1 methyltransferase [Sphingomonas sp. JC676]
MRREGPAGLGGRFAIDPEDGVLLQLIDALRERSYCFVTPTPASHARVVARPGRETARSLADVLGWSLPFAPQLLEPELLALLDLAGMLEPAGDGRLRSRVRASSLMDELYLHSAYPTDGRDAVFFGPDSYRFAALIEAELASQPARPHAHIVDIGTGAGVGGVVAAKLSGAGAATGTDVNPLALRLAAINARAAGVALQTVLGDDLASVGRPIDLALANPPYIVDETKRRYRDGGGMHGGEVALAMARAAIERLAPGGRLILYTGSAIVACEDALRTALGEAAQRCSCTLRYREIDPDVFGEELERLAYRDVDRIALVAAILTKAP